MLLVQLYDDYIGGVDKNVLYTQRIKNHWIDSRQFEASLAGLKKIHNRKVILEIEQVDQIVLEALEIGGKIQAMSKLERNVFDCVLQAYFINSKSKRWII